MRKISIFLITCIFLVVGDAHTQSYVLTQHNDNLRTGWNDGEKALNIRNVNSSSFGKLYTLPVDDQLYAQLLFVSALNLPGIGVRNVLFAATVNNTVYAYDADSTTPVLYWKKNLTPANKRPPINQDMIYACGGFYKDFQGKMGIVGTPVIDTTSKTLYLVARSVDSVTGKNFIQQLHALDLATGDEKSNSPRNIEATIDGYGDGHINGKLSFNTQKANQRCGLLLQGQTVFISYASHCDWGPYHGWVLGYDKNNLEQTTVYCTTPDGFSGGIWMSGAAPSADNEGHIYLAAGNGSAGFQGDKTHPRNRSESIIKFMPQADSLFIESFFTPNNYEELEASDLDFGSTNVMLLPGTNRAVCGVKDGRFYLVNKDSMGGYDANQNKVVQVVDKGSAAHMHAVFSFFENEQKKFVYLWSENTLLKAYEYDSEGDSLNLNNVLSSGVQGPVGNSGAFLSVSSNGKNDSTGILWAAYALTGDAVHDTRPGVLRAFDASDITHELWNSNLLSTDNPGLYAKFNCPTIANGRVYLATFSKEVVVYGLKEKTPDNCLSPNHCLNKPATASSVEIPVLAPENAVDGDPATRWSSAAGDNEYITIDLQKRFQLCAIKILWEASLAQDYLVQISDNGTEWNTSLTVKGNASQENYFSLADSGRYVRIQCLKRGFGAGYSIFEIEVFGSEAYGNCGAPTGLMVQSITDNSAAVEWKTNNASSFIVEYKTVTAGSYNTITTDTNFVFLTGLACATDYLVRVKANCDSSQTGYSLSAPFSTLACPIFCGPLPTRYVSVDVGSTLIPGSACYENGIFTVKGSGEDIWGTEDAFHFMYKPMSANGEIVCKVLTQDFTFEWNKVGLMMRESLAPGSRHAFMAITSGNGAAFQYRDQPDGFSVNSNTGGAIKSPLWLKLIKNGTTYNGYYSLDGVTWIRQGYIDIDFGRDVPFYAGIAITSHYNAQLSTATIEDFEIKGALGVSLRSFSASVNLEQHVDIEWSTSLEDGIESFVVEKSADNISYTDFAEVSAFNTGDILQEYEVEDEDPFDGKTYYRLRITNYSGATTYSLPQYVEIRKVPAPLVFPNPAAGHLFVQPGSDPIQYIKLYDIRGNALISITRPGIQTSDLPVMNIANGIYFLEIKTGRTTFREKIIIKN
jgi:hypothetical protein